MEKSNEILTKLRVQIEYYLSDENLKTDQFFQEKIKSDPEGYLDVGLFDKCNKIKKLNVSKEQIVQAIKQSKDVELDSSEERVKRKDNKPLPELTLLNKKSKRKEEDNEAVKEKDEAGEKSFDPVIYEIHSEKEVDFKWKKIQEELRALKPHLEIIYIRFNKNEGHLGLYKYPNQEVDLPEKFTVEGFEFTIKKCEGDNLINFWKDHGSHFELCIGKNKKLEKKTKKDEKKREENTLKEPLTLGDET